MVISFRLEGALQSWGDHSKLNFRDTAAFPTKSGVIGLIAGAMGLKRDDPKIPEMCSVLKMAVRADRRGTVMVDYQNVGKTVQSDGKVTDRTLQTWRNYLQDASFLVVLEGEEILLDDIQAALSHPVWVPYLGRKSCPASVPILATKHEGCIDTVLRDTETIAPRRDTEIYCEIDGESGIWKNDIILPRTRVNQPNYDRRRVQLVKLDI